MQKSVHQTNICWQLQLPAKLEGKFKIGNVNYQPNILFCLEDAFMFACYNFSSQQQKRRIEHSYCCQTRALVTIFFFQPTSPRWKKLLRSCHLIGSPQCLAPSCGWHSWASTGTTSPRIPTSWSTGLPQPRSPRQVALGAGATRSSGRSRSTKRPSKILEETQ